MTRSLTLPIDDKIVDSLSVGDSLLISGILVTGRDAVHKWLNDTFIEKIQQESGDDHSVYEALKPILSQGMIYHCGPVVAGLDTKQYRFVAAGPTTSIREEPYQAGVMRLFNLKGVIGKGGMGSKTLKACQEVPGVYLHAVGGAASLIAETVKQVIGVFKLEFGVPEAIWVIRVQDLPVVVTMDAHGNSLHRVVRQKSKEALERLIA